MTRGMPPYTVTAGNDEATSFDDIKSAVEAASDMDENGVQDPIQIIDATGTIVLQGGELTSEILDYRASKRGSHTGR